MSQDKTAKKSTVIRTRCTLSDLSLIKERLKASGLTNLSEYMRTAALHNKIVVKRGADNFPLLQELKRSGNNLNQLTMLFHVTGKEPIELRETLTNHSKLLEKIFGAL